MATHLPTGSCGSFDAVNGTADGQLHLRLLLATRMEAGKINHCPDVCSSRVSKSTTVLSRAP